MRWLLAAIGNPQNKLRCIHIAGTKGKGSTAIMIAQILASAGYRVGLYTSPHLTDLRERIQIYDCVPVYRSASLPVNKPINQLISKSDFTQLMNIIVNRTNGQRANWLTERSAITFFELMTALGFLYFAQKKTDFAVIEVGLGGRLDATNLITPLVSVITRIDFDHMDKLGNTIKRIVYEKAGIIKKGIPVVTFRQKTQADMIIRKTARLKDAPLFVVGAYCNTPPPVLGAHQIENCSLALGVIKVLNQRGHTPKSSLERGRGVSINSAMIKDALRELKLPARLELVQKAPDIIIDSAHNPLSIKATVETVRKMKYRNLILVLAISRDKEITKMLNIIIPMANIVILTKTNHPRLLQPEEFFTQHPSSTLGYPKQSDRCWMICSDHKRALEMAQRLAEKEDLILITGSFYLAGEMKRLFPPEK